MSVEIEKVFGKAFSYSLSFKRLLPFFFINLAVIFSTVSFFYYTVYSSSQLVMANYLTEFISTLALLVVAYLVLALVNIFFSGIIVDNARMFWGGKDKPLSDSFEIIKKKYLSIIGASALAGLVAGFSSIVPYLGGIIAIVVSWLFMFVVQAVIVSNKNAIDALTDSYELFMKNKLHIFLFWLLLTLIVLTIVIAVILVPVFIFLLPVITQLSSGVSPTSEAIFAFLSRNTIFFYLGGALLSVILSYITVFQESAKTFFYMSIKKGKK